MLITIISSGAERNIQMYEAPDYKRLKRNIKVLHERLDEIWKN